VSRGTLFGVAANLVRVGTRLLLVPIMIKHLGLGGFGIWSTLMVIAGYLRVGSSGIKVTFQKYVAEAFGSGDFLRANQLVTTGTVYFVAISALILVPTAFFSRSVANLAGIPPEYTADSATVIALMAIAYLISSGMAVFEAAVCGAHRVHLMQCCTVAFTVLEFIFSVLALRMGHGLAALGVGIATGEIGYAICGFVVAHREIPEIALRYRYITTSVGRELARFSGSYQLLNIMELFYVSVVPIVLLRELGAGAAGIYALCDRVARLAVTGLECSLVPLLSGSTSVFSTGSSEQMRAFVSKVFKLSLAGVLLPLAFTSAFGATAVLAWTGQGNQLVGLGIVFLSSAALCRSLSRVGMVLYRSTGGASMDSGAQLLRIAIVLVGVYFGRHWKFYGAVSGIAFAELVGMIFMLVALSRRLKYFSIEQLLGQIVHLFLPVLILVGAGEAVASIHVGFQLSTRASASLQLGVITTLVLALAWPSLILTRYLSGEELAQIKKAFFPRRGMVARNI
jgi:O-antigen/teichoic acid export membrane protein